MRNHGQSPHSEKWNYEAMSEDLNELAVSLNLEKISIIGHSMGGKTAMVFADKYPDKIEKLVIVDIAPREYPIRHRSILDGLLSIDINSISGRNEADKHLAGYVPNRAVRQFLLKNLDRQDQNTFRWKVNLSTIDDHIENVGMATYPERPIEISTLFVRGINSDYVTDDDILDIRGHFPNATTESFGNAGHWLHAEQPEAFLKTAIDFLDG
jgi:pimeloyl-ACP methyl ester carboxylesterase